MTDLVTRRAAGATQTKTFTHPHTMSGSWTRLADQRPVAMQNTDDFNSWLDTLTRAVPAKPRVRKGDEAAALVTYESVYVKRDQVGMTKKDLKEAAKYDALRKEHEMKAKAAATKSEAAKDLAIKKGAVAGMLSSGGLSAAQTAQTKEKLFKKGGNGCFVLTETGMEWLLDADVEAVATTAMNVMKKNDAAFKKGQLALSDMLGTYDGINNYGSPAPAKRARAAVAAAAPPPPPPSRIQPVLEDGDDSEEDYDTEDEVAV